MSFQKNISWVENTPEFQKARILAQNGWRGEWTFYTTLGHIVTKILDMDICFNLPDGTEYRPFTTVWEVNTFFRIVPNQYSTTPNKNVMDHFVSELYRIKVAPEEKKILGPQSETMKDFFQSNVWEMVREDDTVDTLLIEIDRLSFMWIQEVDSSVCADLKEWIIKNCIGMQKTTDDWYLLPKVSRNRHRVNHLEKGKFTEYFSALVVDFPWRRNKNNSHRQMDDIQRKIRSLYVVDPDLEEVARKWGNTQARNTRYL